MRCEEVSAICARATINFCSVRLRALSKPAGLPTSSDVEHNHSLPILLQAPLTLPSALPRLPMLQARPAWPLCSISTGPCLFRRAAQHYSTVSPRIASLLHHPYSAVPAGESLTVNGFVRSVRRQKRIAFAAIGDGSTLKPLQAVLTPDQAEGSVSPQFQG
jgi:hypothetical protein